jgi:hypothetical protein
MDDAAPGISSLKTWSAVARGTIGLFLLVQVVLIVANVVLLVAELGGFASGGSFATWDPIRGMTEVSAYGRLFAFVLAGSVAILGVFFLLAVIPVAGWIYRAHVNLHEAGVSELTYSPAWSVTSFFVPLINFVVPFRAMRELHNRSHGEGPWQAHEPVADVASWWSCHVVAVLVLSVATFVAWLATIPNLYVVQPPGVNTGLFLFSLLLLTGSAIYLFRTIGAVTRAQRQGLHFNQPEVFA